MTRIRVLSPVWVAWVLFSCCVGASTAAAAARRPRVSPRGLQNDKQDDKNNDKNQEDETSPPTLSPTMPTAAPSIRPTMPPVPTLEPTLEGPSSSPTFSVLDGTAGNLFMYLSILDPSVTADDVLEGRANELLNSVLANVLNVLCGMTDVSVVDDEDATENACQERRRLQEQDSVVWSTARVDVIDDETESEEAFTSWTIVYPVLKVGQAYMDVGFLTVNLDEGLEAMEDAANSALTAYIEEGSFVLPEPAQVSVAGEEETTFTQGYTEKLDPDPLHAMRVAGVVLLASTIGVSFLLLRLSGRRKRRREKDSEMRIIERGGLVTEEGLDLMLDAGRRKTAVGEPPEEGTEVQLIQPQIVQSPSNDSDERNLPLPMHISSHMA